jgi:hypothetical protein
MYPTREEIEDALKFADIKSRGMIYGAHKACNILAAAYREAIKEIDNLRRLGLFLEDR